jgi:hypothetical protein
LKARATIVTTVTVAPVETRRTTARAAQFIPIIVVVIIIAVPVEPRTVPGTVVLPLAAVIVAEPVRSAARPAAGLSPGGIGRQHCSNERAWKQCTITHCPTPGRLRATKNGRRGSVAPELLDPPIPAGSTCGPLAPPTNRCPRDRSALHVLERDEHTTVYSHRRQFHESAMQFTA